MRFFQWALLVGGVVSLPLAAGIQGCGGGKGDDTPGDADSDTDTVEDSPDPYEGPTEWVVDDLAIGDEDTGYDLDDHETTDRTDPIGCGKPDGAGGVDNQLGPLLEAIADLIDDAFDADTLLDEAIADASILLLVRAIDLDHFPNDAEAAAHFFLGNDADADLANNLLGDPPGQFLIDPLSLSNPTDESTPLILFPGSTVAEALFSGGPSDFDLSIPVQDTAVLEITISETQIAWVFADDGNLTDGLLGGYVSIAEVIRAMREVEISGFDPAEMEGLVSSVLAGQADIDVIPPGETGQSCTDDPDCGPGQTCESTVCVEPPDNCDALSIGIVFSAVPAQIVGIGEGGDSDTDSDSDSDSDTDTDTDTDTGTDTAT